MEVSARDRLSRSVTKPTAVRPRLSIVVLSWNTRELLRDCLASIERQHPAFATEVLVVDNDSHDGSAELVEKEFPQLTLIRNDRNEGYSRGNNIGIEASSGEFVLLLNSDTVILDDALERAVDFAATHPEYGAIGCQLINPDGSIQRACHRFPTLLTALFFDTILERVWKKNPVLHRYFMRDWDHADSRVVDQPPGAALLVPKKVLDQVGLLDEGLPIFFNDVDFCLRLRDAGYRVFFLAEARIIHHVGQSTRQLQDFPVIYTTNRIAFYRKHHGWFGGLFLKSIAVVRVLEIWWETLRRHRRLDDACRGEMAHVTRSLVKILRF